MRCPGIIERHRALLVPPWLCGRQDVGGIMGRPGGRHRLSAVRKSRTSEIRIPRGFLLSSRVPGNLSTRSCSSRALRWLAMAGTKQDGPTNSMRFLLSRTRAPSPACSPQAHLELALIASCLLAWKGLRARRCSSRAPWSEENYGAYSLLLPSQCAFPRAPSPHVPNWTYQPVRLS